MKSSSKRSFFYLKNISSNCLVFKHRTVSFDLSIRGYMNTTTTRNQLIQNAYKAMRYSSTTDTLVITDRRAALDRMSDDQLISIIVKRSMLDSYNELTSINDHTGAACLLVGAYGTEEEKEIMKGIADRHKKNSEISIDDYNRRFDISNKYYSLIKF